MHANIKGNVPMNNIPLRQNPAQSLSVVCKHLNSMGFFSPTDSDFFKKNFNVEPKLTAFIYCRIATLPKSHTSSRETSRTRNAPWMVNVLQTFRRQWVNEFDFPAICLWVTQHIPTYRGRRMGVGWVGSHSMNKLLLVKFPLIPADTCPEF